ADRPAGTEAAPVRLAAHARRGADAAVLSAVRRGRAVPATAGGGVHRQPAAIRPVPPRRGAAVADPGVRRPGGLGEAGLLEGLVGPDDVLELGFGPAIALVQVGVEALQQVVVARLDQGLLHARLEVQVGQGGAFELADAVVVGGVDLLAGAAAEQAEAVAP